MSPKVNSWDIFYHNGDQSGREGYSICLFISYHANEESLEEEVFFVEVMNASEIVHTERFENSIQNLWIVPEKMVPEVCAKKVAAAIELLTASSRESLHLKLCQILTWEESANMQANFFNSLTDVISR